MYYQLSNHLSTHPQKGLFNQSISSMVYSPMKNNHDKYVSIRKRGYEKFFWDK